MIPALSTFTTFSSILLRLALLLATPARADKDAFYDSRKYNDGDYGNYVTQDFHSSPVKAPWLNFAMPFSACDDGSYYFVAPRGNVAYATLYILDAYGSLVWAPDHHYGEVYNFLPQLYKGEMYLTFWAGDDSIGGHGEGKYHMLDEHYEEYRVIEGANGIGADLHSFTITPDDTATCTLYDIHEVNVGKIRPEEPQAHVWDSIFQELDVETGEALFEWRASDHIDLNDSYVGINSATEENPWDFFHINSVDKDHLGNYLVSARFLRCLVYVDGRNGSILWYLGGKRNSFTDLSDGRATEFIGQHDAHWTADHSGITFFDNRGDWYYQADVQSLGKRVRLDLVKMTAEVEMEYKNPARVYSFSQGSYQTLPNGNVMIGYGFNGVFTEFSPDGKVLCDAYMQPKGRFGSGDVQSYRNLKYNWTGTPHTRPEVAYTKGALYMSWRGSTETRSWLLQDCGTHNGTYKDVQKLEKDGFETRLRVDSHLCTQAFVRIVALDAAGKHLSYSEPVAIANSALRCGLDPAAVAAALFDKTGEASPSDTTDETTQNDNSSDSWPDHKAGVQPDPKPKVDETTETSDFREEHDDLAAQVEDLQLLFGFAILALLGGLLVAWFLFGSRLLGSFWRHSFPTPYNPGSFSGPGLGSGLSGFVDRAKAFVPPWNGRRRWFDGYAPAPSSVIGAGREVDDEQQVAANGVPMNGVAKEHP